jgi:hypothetical protein
MGKKKKIKTRREYEKKWGINASSAEKMVDKMLRSPIPQIMKFLRIFGNNSH